MQLREGRTVLACGQTTLEMAYAFLTGLEQREVAAFDMLPDPWRE